MIDLHFGHLIPTYNRMFPAANNAIALYKAGLKLAGDIYFSLNANTVMAANPIATMIKYRFFRLFIISLGLIVYLCIALASIQSASGNTCFPVIVGGDDRGGCPDLSRAARSGG